MIVDGIQLDLPPLDAEATARVLAPLSKRIRDRCDWLPPGRRCLVGVCGPPGSGKSVFAARLAERLIADGLAASDVALAAMDGYHLHNVALDTHVYHGNHYAELDGQPMRRVKGAPETFDVERLKIDLAHCAEAGVTVPLPAYSREKHDPVPDAIHVGATARVVLIEGNYLLLDEGAWADVLDLLDMSMYLDATLNACAANLTARHVRGGRTSSDAQTHIQQVDAVNYARVSDSAGREDYRVDLADNRYRSLSPAPRSGLVIGAGRIARGLIADMLQCSSCDIVFGARDATRARLDRAGRYTLELYGKRSDRRVLDRYDSVSLSDAPALQRELEKADAVFTAVGGDAVADVARGIARPLAAAIPRRDAPLNIFLFENTANSAATFRAAMAAELPDNTGIWERIGVVSCVVDRLVTSVAGGDSLDLTCCSWNTTTYDAAAVVGTPPRLWGLVPCRDTDWRRRVKMYMTNMPQAVASALGYLQGRELVNDCFRDANVQAILTGAMAEARDALDAAAGAPCIDVPDSAAYAREFRDYYAADVCRDPVTRILAEPIRKLQAGERLLGPALLCVEHGLPLINLARGIAAVMLYDNPADADAVKLRRLIETQGAASALAEISGLDAGGPIPVRVAVELDGVRQRFDRRDD